MNPIVLIPARMAAARLPGKPLAMIEGEAMIARVVRRALTAGIGPVVVAAGEREIAAAASAAGARAVLTDPCLPSGSDRVLAALAQFDPDGRHDVIVNLQGDMPFVEARTLLACAALLDGDAAPDIATAVAPEGNLSDRSNPDVVKAVLAIEDGASVGRALYFTRSALYGEAPIWRHIGLYAWRRAALHRFAAAPPSPLERREKLEQLRALEIGLSIWAAVIDAAPISVDTPADLEAARAHARAHP
ncbi:MAG: 3-deoxy-manno-octulosonate cytidylyltransferase [Caulobacteraceae bacterium]